MNAVDNSNREKLALMRLILNERALNAILLFGVSAALVFSFDFSDSLVVNVLNIAVTILAIVTLIGTLQSFRSLSQICDELQYHIDSLERQSCE